MYSLSTGITCSPLEYWKGAAVKENRFEHQLPASASVFFLASNGFYQNKSDLKLSKENYYGASE
jgi:hypothetical protein